MCLLGVRTCFGPFRSISKHQKCSRSDALIQTSFFSNTQKTSFWTFLPPVEASKLLFGAYRRGFPDGSGDPNMLKNGQKGLPRCRKAQSNVQNTLEVLRNPFPNFRKIAEFGTFRQHRLGQLKKNLAENPDLPANEKNCCLCLVGAHTWGGVRAK